MKHCIAGTKSNNPVKSTEQKTSRQVRTNIIRRIILLVLSIVVVAALGIVVFLHLLSNALIGLGPMLNSPLCDPHDPRGIENIAQIELPPSYRNLESSCGGMQGWAAFAKFEIDANELELFLETTNIEPTLASTGLQETTSSIYLSNNEQYPRSYLYGVHNSFKWFEEIIVDTSRSERWTVYFTVLAG